MSLMTADTQTADDLRQWVASEIQYRIDRGELPRGRYRVSLLEGQMPSLRVEVLDLPEEHLTPEAWLSINRTLWLLLIDDPTGDDLGLCVSLSPHQVVASPLLFALIRYPKAGSRSRFPKPLRQWLQRCRGWVLALCDRFLRWGYFYSRDRLRCDSGCPGWGIFEGGHVQKCEMCDLFPTDQEVAAYLASGEVPLERRDGGVYYLKG